jgi:hypothetical protein
MVCPTRQLVEDVDKASRVISHRTKTIIFHHLPKSETVPKHAQDCSLLKICNPKCCKLFRSYLHFILPCDTSSLLCTEERPSFLFVAYRSSSPPDIPEDCSLSGGVVGETASLASTNPLIEMHSFMIQLTKLIHE